MTSKPAIFLSTILFVALSVHVTIASPAFSSFLPNFGPRWLADALGASPEVEPDIDIGGSRIARFYSLWRIGRCDVLGQELPNDFSYTISSHDGITGWTKQDFLDTLCKQNAGLFDIYFDDYDRLGKEYEKLTLYGVQFYPSIVGGSAPCISPFRSDVTGDLNDNGNIVHIREVFDEKKLSRYNKKCTKRIPYPLPPLLLASSAPRLFASQFIDAVFAGQCDVSKSYLSSDFQFELEGEHPLSMNSTEFEDLCRHLYAEAPENSFWGNSTILSPSDTQLSIMGPALAVVYNQRAKQVCSILFHQGFEITLTGSGNSIRIQKIINRFDKDYYSQLQNKCQFQHVTEEE